MKNSALFQCKSLRTSHKMLRNLLLTTLILFGALHATVQAQASLSIQGILKKANGVAVDDGTYTITFKLYTQPSGGSAIWTEVQNAVEVSSGIYSTILGNTNALNVPFNQLYYLGVTLGSTEMTPRIQLTSAPYALSLIGATNQFPSSGVVSADSINVNGGVIAKSGAPGLNGANHNGYGFTGEKDSGLYSTSSGRVSLFADNVEMMAVINGTIFMGGNTNFAGNISTANVALSNGGKVTYNGKDDWRLVAEDYLTGGSNGWNVYNPLSGQHTGWSNPSSAGAAPVGGSVGQFRGQYLYPADNNQTLKKFYDLSGVGSFSYIKVKFKYYFFDTWGFGGNDKGWAAFADGSNGSQMRMGWVHLASFPHGSHTSDFGTNEFQGAVHFDGNNDPQHGDYMMDGEMTAFKSGNSFWLYFGAALDEDTNNERYGVGMIEVWVK